MPEKSELEVSGRQRRRIEAPPRIQELLNRLQEGYLFFYFAPLFSPLRSFPLSLAEGKEKGRKWGMFCPVVGTSFDIVERRRGGTEGGGGGGGGVSYLCAVMIWLPTARAVIHSEK